MDEVMVMITGMLKGILDSLRGTVTLFYLDDIISRKNEMEKVRHSYNKRTSRSTPQNQISDKKVLKRIIQCCGLNGGIFWLSIVLFYQILLPSLQWIIISLFVGESRVANLLWYWMQTTLSWTFSAVWVVPLFLLSKLVNGLWFQDIADSAYWSTQGRSQYYSSFSKFIADALFSVVIQSMFLIQAVFVSAFPISFIGQSAYVAHLCLLYSLYAFEYKWCKQGWPLHHRLMHIEINWPYFLGFGLPLALLTSLPDSYFISGCVFSILFPLLIISANEAKPVVAQSCFPRLKLFSLVIALSNSVFYKTVRGGVSSSPSKQSILPSESAEKPTKGTSSKRQQQSAKSVVSSKPLKSEWSYSR